ncbi:LOW QUALITY PROTEIN: hypothetical protein ACG7TL_004089 [Trametes sanguinea]
MAGSSQGGSCSQRLNPKCVELGVRTAIALNAEVQRRSAFDRKHYFYADLPSGYQITQQYAPIARNGSLQLKEDNISVRIKQVQLEQDTGKSTFLPRNRLTAIDLNRAGMGLMEIVSEPDMRLRHQSGETHEGVSRGSSPEEAGSYALLRSVGSSDGNMEQGSLRCDVNVSVNRVGGSPGTRCEIKNLNSVKNMMVAITCEAFRQIALLDKGIPVTQETRGFDEEKAETYSLRSKEDAPDYRYMPDPNIPPLLLDKSYIDEIRHNMPELPDATRARLLSRGLSKRDVEVLMLVDSGREVGYDGQLGHGAVAYFDEVSQGRNPKEVVNWYGSSGIHLTISAMLTGFSGSPTNSLLAFRNETFSENPISVQQMGDLIDLVSSGKVTDTENGTVAGTSGKTILRHILSTRTPDLPSKIAQDLQLLAVSDGGASLEKWCRDAIAALPEEAEAVRQGNAKVVNKIIGYVMKASRGAGYLIGNQAIPEHGGGDVDAVLPREFDCTRVQTPSARILPVIAMGLTGVLQVVRDIDAAVGRRFQRQEVRERRLLILANRVGHEFSELLPDLGRSEVGDWDIVVLALIREEGEGELPEFLGGNASYLYASTSVLSRRNEIALQLTARPASWTKVELPCQGWTWLRKMTLTFPAYLPSGAKRGFRTSSMASASFAENGQT